MKSFQIHSSADVLLEKAREIAGISDVLDADIQEPLRRLLHSLNTEAQLSESGAAAMEQRLLRILSNRLRMFRDLARHPEINEEKIVRPVFITGGARTGSTKLHKVLAATGNFKFINFWQAHTLSLRSGDRSEDPAERMAEADEYIGWLDSRAPLARQIHAYDTFEPEEETHIFEHACFGPFTSSFAFVPGFLGWYATQDFRQELRFFKQALQYLQWQFHGADRKPWILKYPAYQGMEPLLKEAFPDAVMLTTHREPLSTLTSSASLFSAFYAAYSDASHNAGIGALMLEGQAARIDLFLQSRRAHPDVRGLDISYTELLTAPESVVEKAYGHAAMPFDERVRAAVRAWEDANQQHKHGAHKYTLEGFALTREQAEPRFAAYSQQFREYF